MIDVETMINESAKLEPLPVSLSRLASLVAQPDADMNAIKEVIALDEALTAQVLRWANSAASGSRFPISTVEAAVVRVGTGNILAMATGARVRSNMAGDMPQYGFEENELWKHSVASAFAAEALGQYCKVRVPPESFTAALLHDIGKLLLMRHLTDETQGQLERARKVLELTHRQAEIEILGTDHAEVGALLAEKWGLPETIVAGIRYHHNPEDCGDPVADVVHVANIVAKCVGVGLGYEGMNLTGCDDSVERLGLGPDSFEALCCDVAIELETVLERYS